MSFLPNQIDTSIFKRYAAKRKRETPEYLANREKNRLDRKAKKIQEVKIRMAKDREDFLGRRK